ncbi:MAG: fibronectin type III domain-containing protein, partial [Syntrophorhabdales bacterium]
PAGSTLTAIDAGSAYWIKMTSPSQLQPLGASASGSVNLLTPQAALSSQVTIAWDANSQPQVKGYKLYYGTSSGQYTTNADVENQTAATASGLQAGATYFFAATAYDSSGNESNYSQELSFTIPQNAQSQSITLNLPSGIQREAR